MVTLLLLIQWFGAKIFYKKITTNVDPVFDKNIFFPYNKYQKVIGTNYSPFKIKKLLEEIDDLILKNSAVCWAQCSRNSFREFYRY